VSVRFSALKKSGSIEASRPRPEQFELFDFPL